MKSLGMSDIDCLNDDLFPVVLDSPDSPNLSHCLIHCSIRSKELDLRSRNQRIHCFRMYSVKKLG